MEDKDINEAMDILLKIYYARIALNQDAVIKQLERIDSFFKRENCN